MAELPYQTSNDLPEDVRARVTDLLNQRLAGTARMVAERSGLPEYPHTMAGGAEHVTAQARALAAFGGHVRRAIAETGDWGDQDSADICTEISRGVDKWLWFVEAHLQSCAKTFSLSLHSDEETP